MNEQAMLIFARAMKRHATAGDYYYDGRNIHTPYFRKARRIHTPTGTSLLFTRDVGMHTCGWFKNPDYERCYHLSISFLDIRANTYRAFEWKLAATWVKLFYRDWLRFVWEEGTYYDIPGDHPEVRHYRVMCDPAWQPILPRGEVYTRDFTEKDWRSFSEVQALAQIIHPSELD